MMMMMPMSSEDEESDDEEEEEEDDDDEELTPIADNNGSKTPIADDDDGSGSGGRTPVIVESDVTPIAEDGGRTPIIVENDATPIADNDDGEHTPILFNTTIESDFKIRTGLHFEHRPGMVNFSVVGRNANKEQRSEYVTYDTLTSERATIARQFNTLFPSIRATVGGETGIDISPLFASFALKSSISISVIFFESTPYGFQKIVPFILLKLVSRKSISESIIFNLPNISGFSIEPLR